MLVLVGTLPTSLGTLYTVPSMLEALVDHIRLVNDTGAAVSVYLYLTAGGTTINMVPTALQFDAKDFLADEHKWRLSEGAYISGYSSVSGVKYYFGGEETRRHP